MCKAAVLLLVISFNFVFSTNPSIIIIGAGSAGIAAASKLLENNFTNLTVLEAEDRIGGRIRSVKLGKSYVDLGAEFCRGEENNIVYELVKELNVLQHGGSVGPEVLFYYSNGSEIKGVLAEDWISFIKSYSRGALRGDRNIRLGYDRSKLSFGQDFLKVYNTTILNKYKKKWKDLKVAKEALRYLERSSIAEDGAFTWDEPSASGHFQQCKGDQEMTWSGLGYKTILEVLLKRYPDPKQKFPIDGKIHFKKRVTKISWNETDGVFVNCADGSVYAADHVIFTPSVGVLKEQQNVMFYPELPQSKQRAISAIGFGCVMKIVMHFSYQWWDHFKRIGLIWSDQDLQRLERESLNRYWVSNIAYLQNSVNNSNVLVALVTGPRVPEIESKTEDVIKEGVVFVLKKFLGRTYKVMEPDRVLRSTWCTDGNFRGAYSYETVQAVRENQENQGELAKPLVNTFKEVPTVLFAGEATHPVHYATVHGAIETGHREAERIMNIYEYNVPQDLLTSIAVKIIKSLPEEIRKQAVDV